MSLSSYTLRDTENGLILARTDDLGEIARIVADQQLIDTYPNWLALDVRTTRGRPVTIQGQRLVDLARRA